MRTILKKKMMNAIASTSAMMVPPDMPLLPSSIGLEYRRAYPADCDPDGRRGPWALRSVGRRGSRPAPDRLVLDSGEDVQRLQVLQQLLHPACTQDHRRHVRIAQAPGD